MNPRTNKSIQERGQDVLEFIRNFHERNSTSPTYDEIMQGVGLSTKSHVANIINYLVQEGSVEKKDGIARGLRLPGWTLPGSISIHLKGVIAASNQNLSIVFDEYDGDTTFEIPPSLIPSNTDLSTLYALTVQGDSMEDDNIVDGDTVILKRSDSWNDGDTVAVWLNQEEALTLKRLYQGKNGTVKLQARSHKHQPRIENMKGVVVMGRLVAMFRKFDN